MLFRSLRRENLKACGGILGDVEEETRGTKRAATEGIEGEGGEEPKRQKVYDDGPYPMGVYEAQTGIVLCKFPI